MTELEVLKKQVAELVANQAQMQARLDALYPSPSVEVFQIEARRFGVNEALRREKERSKLRAATSKGSDSNASGHKHL